MAREVLIKVWCDVCKHLDPPIYNDAREFTVAVGTAKPRVLALCEQDEKDLLTPLRDVLPWGSTSVETAVQPIQPALPGVPARSDGVGPRNGMPSMGVCPACDVHKDSLRTHWRDTHQDDLGQTLGQALGLPTPFPCPEPGCPLEYPNRQGLSQHIRVGNHLTRAVA